MKTSDRDPTPFPPEITLEVEELQIEELMESPSPVDPLRDQWEVGATVSGIKAYPPHGKTALEKARARLISLDFSKVNLLYDRLSPDCFPGFCYERGSLFAQLGKDREAVEYFEECLARRPGFLPAIWSLERILRRRKNPGELIALMERVSDKGEAGLPLSIQNTFAGIEHEKSQLPEIALDYYREAIVTSEDHFVPLFAGLTTALNRGELLDAGKFCSALAGHFEESATCADFLLFAGHLLARAKDFEGAISLLNEALAISHHNAHEIWFELQHIATLSGDVKKISEVLKERCKFHITRGEYNKAVPLALELSIILEGEMGNPTAAMSVLKLITDIAEYPLLTARMADLAWHRFDFDWIVENRSDQNSYMTFYSACKLGKPLQGDPGLLSPVEKLEYHFLSHITNPKGGGLLAAAQLWESPRSQAPLLLLAATHNLNQGEPASHIMEKWLNIARANGIVTNEGLWQAYWIFLLEDEYASSRFIEDHLESFEDAELGFLLRELAHQKIIREGDYSSALKLLRRSLETRVRESADVLFCSLLARLGKEKGVAALALEASNLTAHGDESTLLALWTAKRFALAGDHETGAFILKERLHDKRALRAWELFHRQWSGDAQLSEVVQELWERGDEQAAFELALLHTATNPRKAQEMAG
ncbi:tetratricopeptide repeat protein, partial [Myxococcota bacterium]|nr:tetratricopeptide repeat protein [Myxococcota bacterium]